LLDPLTDGFIHKKTSCNAPSFHGRHTVDDEHDYDTGDDVPVSALRRRGIKKPRHVVEKGKDVSTEAPAALPALDPFSLKARFKARCVPGDTARQNWQIRVHRAISWYKDACECPETLSEARFLFLWIALNSLYSHWDNEHNIPGKDGAARQEFVRWVCDPHGMPT